MMTVLEIILMFQVAHLTSMPIHRPSIVGTGTTQVMQQMPTEILVRNYITIIQKDLRQNTVVLVY